MKQQKEKNLFEKGHNACAGCGPAIAMREIMEASGKNTIVSIATGCMEVVSTPYPLTSWNVPVIHSAFENAAATASGIDAALKNLGKRENTNLIVIAGDGGTFDIGLQALSGAIERGHKFLFICYDNGAYQNTGNQRSGSTPKYSDTTTSPYGSKIHGKQEFAKNMPFIIASHGCYAATANIAYPQDFKNKIKKALSMNKPAYIQVFSPCVPGWKYNGNMTVNIARLAVQTKASMLYEIENGVAKLNMPIENPKPIKEFLKMQGRFKHLNENEIKSLQNNANSEYSRIKKLSDEKINIF